MKNLFKKHKRIIIVSALVVCTLGFAFWYGGSAPGLQGWSASVSSVPSASEPTSAVAETVSPTAAPSNILSSASPSETSKPSSSAFPEASPELPASSSTSPSAAPAPGSDSGKPLTVEQKLALAESIAGGSSSGVQRGDAGYSESQGMQINPQTGKDQYLTDPVPEGKPIPVEPENAVITDRAHTCTLSVRCDTILDNMSWLDPNKVELVLEDGVIFATTTVTFYEGESVFNVLQREMKKAKIHMEFANTPMYNSAYIEGINNLYEFDCGELSGWMYKVNNWFPNYGCSRYQLKDGDVVEWVYTCNLGIDVGGYYSVGS
jgi:hypothetical protein